jgi:hypothetical protein
MKPMMGERRVAQEHLFYEFSLERHVPETHLLRSIDRFVELDGLRRELAPFYSEMGRPSIDPELLIRMLIVGYCFGIRSERRLCEEVHLNLGTAGFFRRAWCVNSIRSMRPLAGRRLGGFQASLRARRLMASADRMGLEGSGRPSFATRSADGVSCRNQRCGLVRPSHPPGCPFPL